MPTKREVTEREISSDDIWFVKIKKGRITVSSLF